ncbi:DEAD/DEAH box helicase, partial [Staphylococcus epidermidis]|nr:DEAD/DEAH box helicase [Staphylococcus epidermidis]
MSKHPFEHFHLHENLIEAVKNLNFEKPTEIQNKIITRIIKETNLLGQS